MESKNEDLTSRLVKKSIEAFILGLEVYNKPTIKYRVEAFSFFICNVWELMLKARLLKLGKPIYYKGTDRTFDLSHVVRAVYTDKRQPLRINLEKIIDLRNISTHFVTEDYETIYAPLFQACVFNFCEQMSKFHGVEIVNFISPNFLTLTANMSMLENDELKIKYTKEMSNKLLQMKEDIETAQKETSSNALAIPIEIGLHLVKDQSKADMNFRYDPKSPDGIRTVKQLIDPGKKYTLSYGNVVSAVNKQIQSKQIRFDYQDAKGVCNFNTHTLQQLIGFYDIKNNENYAYFFAGVYRYSQSLVEFIVAEIKRTPDLMQKIKMALKKTTPGS